MGRGRRIRRGSEPTRTTNLDGIFTLNECADYIAEDKWPTIPDTINDLNVTTGNAVLDLSWTEPSTNGLSFTLYSIEYTPNGGSPTVVTTSNTSYQLTGLVNDTEYSVRVGAVVGNRINYSAAVTGTPVAIQVLSHQVNTMTRHVKQTQYAIIDNSIANVTKYRVTVLSSTGYVYSEGASRITYQNQIVEPAAVPYLLQVASFDRTGFRLHLDYYKSTSLGDNYFRLEPYYSSDNTIEFYIEALNSSDEVVAISETITLRSFNNNDD